VEATAGVVMRLVPATGERPRYTVGLARTTLAWLVAIGSRRSAKLSTWL
jgi:hypothetical protein